MIYGIYTYDFIGMMYIVFLYKLSIYNEFIIHTYVYYILKKRGIIISLVCIYSNATNIYSKYWIIYGFIHIYLYIYN